MLRQYAVIVYSSRMYLLNIDKEVCIVNFSNKCSYLQIPAKYEDIDEFLALLDENSER